MNPPRARSSRTQRPDPATLAPLEITASRRRMLELLHRYRYLTPRLLALAYSNDEGRRGRGFWHVQHELGLLWRHGLVERHYEAKRPTGEGSEQFIYTLSKEGGRVALDPATYGRDRQLIYRRVERKRGNYDHHLGLASLQLILELGASPWTVESFRCDERSDRSRFRVRLDAGGEHTVQPDAWVTVGYPNGQQALYLFELDLARKNNERLDTRFDCYATYLTRHGAALRNRERANNVVVVFVAPNEPEVLRLMERATPILARWSRRERPLFLFWNLEDWYETKQRRRISAGTEKTWAVRELCQPKSILARPTLTNIGGDERFLVQPIA